MPILKLEIKSIDSIGNIISKNPISISGDELIGNGNIKTDEFAYFDIKHVDMKDLHIEANEILIETENKIELYNGEPEAPPHDFHYIRPKVYSFFCVNPNFHNPPLPRPIHQVA